VIRAKGLVNTREHLESLFEAQERGVASLQQYVGRAAGHDSTSSEPERWSAMSEVRR